MRRPRGPRNARATPDTSPKVMRGPLSAAATANTGAPLRTAASAAQAMAATPARVDGHDREIAIDVDAQHAALGQPSVGEGDRHRVVVDVVGVGQDAALGDDDAAAAAPAASDVDDGTDRRCWRPPGRRPASSSRMLLMSMVLLVLDVTCKSQVTTNHAVAASG